MGSRAKLGQLNYPARWVKPKPAAEETISITCDKATRELSLGNIKRWTAPTECYTSGNYLAILLAAVGVLICICCCWSRRAHKAGEQSGRRAVGRGHEMRESILGSQAHELLPMQTDVERKWQTANAMAIRPSPAGWGDDSDLALSPLEATLAGSGSGRRRGSRRRTATKELGSGSGGKPSAARLRAVELASSNTAMGSATAN
jgi:hypothetical protein